MADEEGFEPPELFARSISSAVPSTTRPPIREYLLVYESVEKHKEGLKIQNIIYQNGTVLLLTILQ